MILLAIFCYNELSHFAIMLGHFMISSAILEILSSICYSTKPFCKIAQPLWRFHQLFSKRGRVGREVAHGSVGWLDRWV
jgi:hypothetical protein